jgi:phosphoribosylanthranilate isomerase
MQIYEVSIPKEAQAISEIGVDHVGILVGKGEFPRELSIKRAAKVCGWHRIAVEILSAVPDC